MRPPYGSYNNLVLEVAYARNQSGAYISSCVAKDSYHLLL